MPRSKSKYPEITEIREDSDSLRTNVVELTNHLKQDTKEQSVEWRGAAMDRLDQIKSSGQKQMKSLEKQVKAKPVETIGITFVAGMALSYLAGRR